MEKLEIAGGKLPQINITNYYTRFIEYIDVKPKSAETYTKALRRFNEYLKENGISAPDRQTIINWRDDLAARLKASTVQLYLTAVKLFFKWLEQEGIYRDIADRVKAPKQNIGHKKDYLTVEQSRQLLTAATENKRDYALLLLMLTTGIRTVEVTRANIQDLKEVAGQPVLFIQGKGADDKTEYVKIDPALYTAILEYLEERQPEKTDPLFTSSSNRHINGRLTTRSISRIVKKYLIKAGYNSERLTAHSLRHTTAHINLKYGATVEETRDLLRHRNIATTYIYINEMNREKNNSELRVARAILKKGGRK